MEENRQIKLTLELIWRYCAYLREQEKSTATISKYRHDLTMLYEYLNGAYLTKAALINWKEHLEERYAAASINTMVAAVNCFLDFCGCNELRLKPLKVQKSMFCDGSKELTREEYTRLVCAARKKGDERLSLVIQTICATGIRVSELRFITVQAIGAGRAEINNKGKRRTVFIPEKLRRLLRQYERKQQRVSGPVFVTKAGTPLDRSNIWRSMKALCESACIAPGKVFPHNLRHLFARTYYSLKKDLSRLADILGHSDVNTTKIYTMESGSVHARQVDSLGLIIT